MNEHSWRELTRQGREIWNTNAPFWDDYMKEGHDFRCIVIAHTIEQLLKLRKDAPILELVCGNGNYPRRLAQLGACMVAFDISEKFFQLARARETHGSDRMAEISLMNIFA